MREEDGPTYVPSKGWAEMIRKVYEVDPLRCPACGGQCAGLLWTNAKRASSVSPRPKSARPPRAPNRQGVIPCPL